MEKKQWMELTQKPWWEEQWESQEAVIDQAKKFYPEDQVQKAVNVLNYLGEMALEGPRQLHILTLAIHLLLASSKKLLKTDDLALYDVARKTCHDLGMPWVDPRTGITYDPPKKRKPGRD